MILRFFMSDKSETKDPLFKEGQISTTISSIILRGSKVQEISIDTNTHTPTV